VNRRSVLEGFALDYDRMVDWRKRLAIEGPFLRKLFSKHAVRSLLEGACGPGHHAIYLSSFIERVRAFDIDGEMLQLARGYSSQAKAKVRFFLADFLNFPRKANGVFDAFLCLGNSFAHLQGRKDLRRVLANVARVLKPEGLAVIHLINFELMLGEGPGVRFVSPRLITEKGLTTAYVKFFVVNDRRIGVHFVKLLIRREGISQETHSGELTAFKKDDILAAAKGLFRRRELFGDYDFSRYVRKTSPQMILVARK